MSCGKKFLCFLWSVTLSLTYTGVSVSALNSKNYLDNFAQNDITFYDPTCTMDNSLNCTPVSGSSITWVGDSYTAGAESIIKEKFPGVDVYYKASKWLDKNVSTGSAPSRHPDGMSVSEDNPSGLEIIKHLKSHNQLREYLVVALGTNNGSAATKAGVEEILSTVGDSTKVVFTTAYTKENTYNDFNAMIREVAASHDNVVLADWASDAKDHLDEYFAQNSVHPTGHYDAWVDVIARALGSGSGTVALPAETIEYLDAANVKALAEANMERYKYASDATGVPWQAIAALHFREASMRSEASISNGQNLTTDGSCYTNVDGFQICGNANEDAKSAAEALVRMGKYVYDVDVSTDTSFEALGKAFLAYNRGGMYTCNGRNVDWTRSPYAMGWVDSEHIGMYFIAGVDDTGCDGNKINSVGGLKDGRPGALAVYYYLGGGGCSGFGDTSSTPGRCKEGCGDTIGGVTTKEIDGTTYAFPLAGAAKSNYLDNEPGRESVLSGPKNSWGHHDYPAVDLGLRASMAGYAEKTPSDYSTIHGLSDMYFYSDGVPVVAFVSGTITSYRTYSNNVPSDWVDKCASVSYLGDDGNRYWLGHMSFSDEIYQRFQNGNAHFNAGEKIGEIGPPPCAQTTQSHLHLDIQEGDKDLVQRVIAELYEALPENGNALTSSTSGNCGGSYANLTEDQAKKLAHYYNTSHKSIGCCGLMNCVEFSIFFVSELTSKGTPGKNPTRGNGKDVAGNLVADGYASGGTEAKAWSVFSTAYNGVTHTGVVVGVNSDGTINTIEAAYPGWHDGYTDGFGNARVYMNKTPNPDMYYAYFDQYLNTKKLSEILNE